jgi:hypothetical protein
VSEPYYLGQNVQLLCIDISWYVEGFGRWRGTFWLHRATLTLKGPAAQQATAVYHTGVNKIPTKFDTLYVTPLEGLKLFKGLTARHTAFKG